jgi:hypothetical protein
MKEFLKWMQAGLAGIGLQIYQMVFAGAPVNAGAVVKVVVTALAVRAAGWIIQKFGPQATP